MTRILLLFILFPLITLGQVQLNYGSVPEKEGRYGSYLTQNGRLISLNDTLTVGMPSGPDGFRYITARWVNASNIISGRKVTVNHIRTFKRNRLKGKVFLQFKAYGLAPFFIDYEMAFTSGEILEPLQKG